MFVDAHAHIWRVGLPLAAVRRHAPQEDALVETYLAHLDAHQLQLGILVQPSFLGTDNSYMLNAVKDHPDRLRAVVSLAPDTAEETIAQMTKAGVVGIRFNLVGLDIPDFTSGDWPRFLGNLHKYDWHVEVHREARDLPQLIEPLLHAGLRVVVNHFGRPDPADPLKDPGFRYLLSTAATKRVWVKVSAAYRTGREAGNQNAKLMMPSLLDSFGPERLVWGSDWPHAQHETIADYDGTFAALQDWVPDAAARRAILSTTPAELFLRRQNNSL